MALKLKVTTAGRAALVNAANTGTLPVLIAQVGVTSTAFTPAADGSDLVLPGEIKRLVTFGGAAVADDTIHSVIRDTSTDTYTWRGFGLYLADGITLFALYGQADPILEKSAGAMAMLATDIIFADIDAAALTFGDASFLNPPATVDVQGVVELATDAEAIAGVDAVRAVTPKGLLAKLTALLGAGAPSAFVKSLLTAVDLVAFRTLLSIKTAASYDIGVGNGLDADLLDGQHGAYYRSYANLTDVPGTFTPSPHTHSAADITSGVLGVLRGGTGVAALTAGSYLIGNGTGAIVVKTPAQVLVDIGAAAVQHSHPTSDIIGLDNALAARPLQTSVTAQISGAVNALINGSPGALDTLNELATAMGNDANFAATVTNALATKLTAVQGYQSDANNLPGSGFFAMTGNAANTPRNDWATILNIAPFGTGERSVQFGYSWNFGDSFALRSLGGAWRDLWHSGNFSPATKANVASPIFTGTVITLQVDPTAGYSIEWNRAGIEYGETSFINNKGGGGGGFAWFNRAGPTAPFGAPIMTLGSSGNLAVPGGMSCITMNATGSDIALKDDVEPFTPRPLHRLLAALTDTHGAVVSFTHRADRAHRVGVIAQDMVRVEPAYTGEMKVFKGQVKGVDAGMYKTVDMASAAYEQAMWAGQEIDRLLARIEALESR
jgi:hypothetical protein